jgi:hypothetical protein
MFDHARRVNLFVLQQLILHDANHSLCRDTQPSGHFFFVAANQHP